MQHPSQSAFANSPDRCPTRRRPKCCRSGLLQQLFFLMEAYDGLSGAIGERPGFTGHWASGLTTACSLGYRDANRVLSTQLVDAVQLIADPTELPAPVDGDRGFGNLDKAKLFARTLRQRGPAGAPLNASRSPTINSFLEHHHLTDIDESSGRARPRIRLFYGIDVKCVFDRKALPLFEKQLAGFDEFSCLSGCYDLTKAEERFLSKQIADR
ncbi:isocitrate lyase/phosphoenolpyruvate mutase family protein [Bradyrhizobium australiense]|uniref:Uncharacterized protein n=1 Tax=Bradyrhizobium australiense TaxID=2721161 RepID=A0A7Y4GZ80_9BRAD|nr:isocitrate lyase/phosphoenolpyruvate mutase family protein [Bradyrhizobium australiense]NOJ44576.1 hypothetical protein [Bradyrhizobium australiense]